MRTKDLSSIAILTSMSVVISIIESYFTFIGNYIPGLKLGLANIVIVFALYKYNFKIAFNISVIRVILVSLLRTGFGLNFFFSLSGAIFSIISMYITKKTKLSIIGVSIVGSIFHAVGEILIGILFLNNINVIYYLPYLLILSIITGIFIGYFANKIISYTKKIEI